MVLHKSSRGTDFLQCRVFARSCCILHCVAVVDTTLTTAFSHYDPHATSSCTALFSFADLDRQRDEEEARLHDELAMLRDMASRGNTSMSSDEISAAVRERQDRLAGLAAGGEGRRGSIPTAVVSHPTKTLSQEQIYEIFEFYANYGRSAVMTYQDSLDGFMFMKFARECPDLLAGKLNKTEVDLIFMKAKPKFERRLDFAHFLDALSAVAERRYPDYSPADGLRLLIANHLVPHYDLVRAEMEKTGESEIPLTGIFKKLYDVRSYTGVYAERFRSGDGRINGESENRPGRHYLGNTNTATDEIIHDMSVLMRPNLHGAGTMISPANHTLLKRTGSTRAASPTGLRSPTGAASVVGGAGASTASVVRPPSPRRTTGASGGGSGSSVALLSPPAARSRAAAGAGAPTPRGGAGSSAASTAGASAAAGDAKAQTEALLAALAAARAGDPSQLMSLTQALAQSIKGGQAGSPAQSPAGAGAGPSGRAAGGGAADALRELRPGISDREASAIRAEVEELEADIAHLKTQLSQEGAHVDGDYVREVTAAIHSRRDRIEALVTGAGKAAALSTPAASRSGTGAGRAFRFTPAETGGGGGGGGGGDAGSVVMAPPALTQDQIHDVFEFYANFGRSAVMTHQDSLDSFMFMKFARECPDLLDAKLNKTEVDLIFMKAKPKFERRLGFSHFLDALSAIAERKYPDYSPADGLRLLIANHLAPHYELVQAEMRKTGDSEIPLGGVYKKLYDVRSYTGVYAERFRTGDGRINGETDNRPGRQYMGNTNTATDEVIHDISVLMRPNLRSGTMMTSRTVAPGGSPRRAVQRSVSPSRSPGTLADGRSVVGSVRTRG